MVVPFARRTLLRTLGLSIASPALVSRAIAADQTPSSEPVAEGKGMLSEVTHRTLTLSGLKFHVAEIGVRQISAQ